jgi:hypothetical protein
LEHRDEGLGEGPTYCIDEIGESGTCIRSCEPQKEPKREDYFK